MALTTSAITGRVPLPTDALPEWALLTFTLSAYDTQGMDIVPPAITHATLKNDGGLAPDFRLWRNTAGLRGTHYTVTASWTHRRWDGTNLSGKANLGKIQIGDKDTYTLAELLNSTPPSVPETGWFQAASAAEVEEVKNLAAEAGAIRAQIETDADRAEAARDDASAVAGIREFRDVATLLANATLTYGAGAVQVQAGDTIRTRAEGFSYQVAASGATDHHITTTGGVKLYVLPIWAAAAGGIWPLAALGLDFTGATNESAKVQKLFDAAGAAGGGLLYHPGGTIRCGNITGRAGVGLTGNGFKSLFVRNQANSDMIRWSSADAVGIAITGCAFDLNTIPAAAGQGGAGGNGDYVTCVRMDDFRKDGTVEFLDNNVTVTECHFFNSGAATAGDWTLAALQFRGINGYTVANNSAAGVQFKLGGAETNTIGANIVNNRFFNCRAYCISVVVRGDGTTHLRNVNIDGNTMEGFARGAIFVGFDDGTGGSLIMENVVVQNNICTVTTFGGTNKNGAFVVYRMPEAGGRGGYVIKNNTVTVTAGYLGNSSQGLIFSSGGSGDDVLLVEGNTFEVRGQMERLLSQGQRTRLIDNIVSGAILRIANTASETTVVRGNTFHGRGQGGLRIFYTDTASYVDIQDNEWVDCSLPAAFEDGLIRTAPAAGVALKGCVARNTVRTTGVITEAFMAERAGSGTTSIIYERNDIGAGIKFFDVRQSALSNLRDNFVADEAMVRRPPSIFQGALGQTPLSADPATPAVGTSVMWVSDGTGTGDAGDILIKVNVGGTTKTVTLVDYSAV